EIVIVYDDLDLPLGTVRIRKEGGSGGHNGVKSIIERVGTETIARIRIGIGNAMSDTIPAERFVLEKFRVDELEGVQMAIDRSAEALQMMLEQGTEAAMNEFNERA
ncbi:aminoacyl-tRNA hydrolase, partial [Patescibacteria group bacterium]